jgi:sulfur-oxidizing protein SoxA
MRRGKHQIRLRVAAAQAGLMAMVLVAGLMLLASAGAAQKPEISGRDKPVPPPSADHPLTEIWSGSRYMSGPLQRMQDDDGGNPGMIWHDYGQELWSRKDGEAGRSCASCHNLAENSMRGTAARYPVYFEPDDKLINLEQRINICRVQGMKAEPWDWESDALLALSTFVRGQSRGIPVKVRTEGRAQKFFEPGRALFYRRLGQLDMSCADCHERHVGNKWRARVISQGQSSAFPAYRLDWESVGSLHRQIASCNRLVRAEPFAPGSDELVNIELYLAWRGAGLPVETPGIRP